MKGKVKWFSTEKGYGFIHGEDGVDRFFHVREINGGDLPGNGGTVTFDSKKGDRRPCAVNVTLTGAPERIREDIKPTCSSCNRSFVPRIITGPPVLAGKKWRPVPKYSVCPFCAATHQEFRSSFGSNYEVASLVLRVGAFVIIGGFFVLVLSQ